ncbi:MAG: hypothetical protein K5856_03760 [Bacteroidaceae bacterium]|nr:hypothetical protein [Bacteroidaceae bacterium]
MYSIQTNQSGTRSMQISDEHLATIRKYGLFNNLTDSNGFVDESVLEKLKLGVRSLIAAESGDIKDLLTLCIDVIYHDNMKAFGLQKLIGLYNEWCLNNPLPTED